MELELDLYYVKKNLYYVKTNSYTKFQVNIWKDDWENAWKPSGRTLTGRTDRRTDRPPAELQIIFESNAYLPPNFLLNADFQNVKLYFHPLYFFQCVKEKVLLFWSAYL